MKDHKEVQEQEISFARYWEILMGQIAAEQAEQEEYINLCKGYEK